MRNRIKLINTTILVGTAALFCAAFSAINFVVVLAFTPEIIAKIRFLKFGMSISGSVLMFINSMCIFVLAVEIKYNFEHYVKGRKP